MTLLGLLVALIILCLVFWCVQQLAGAFGLPEPIKTVILVLLVIIAIFWLLGLATGHVPSMRLY